jgi:7-cyano-7-deazaguanine synthase
MTRAVVLLSGGLDSCVTAAVAREEGHEVHAVSFDYGQLHRRELEAAEAVAEALDIASHRVLEPDVGSLGGSALTDEAVDVPEDRDEEAMEEDNPATYVPARNTIFLSYGLGAAEVAEAGSIWIGATALDYSGYPDCRPEYFEAFQGVADLATKRAVEGEAPGIRVPLLHDTKAEIVERGVALDAPLGETWTCYQGGEVACGTCDACQLRRKGFREAGHEDPVPYADEADA